MATADALRLLQQYLAPYAMTPPPQPQRAAMGSSYEGEGQPDLLQALTGARSPSPMAPMPPGLMESLPKSVQDSLMNRRSYSEQQTRFMGGPSYSSDRSGLSQENLSQDPYSRERLPEELNFQRMAPQLDQPTREGEILRGFFPQYEAQGSPYPWQNSLNSMMFPPFVNY